MRKALCIGAHFMLAFVALLVLTSGVALAQGRPARTETLTAGPYVVDVNLSQDPPQAEQPLELTVVPHDSSVQLSGRVVVQPGFGIDATEMHANLKPATGEPGTLEGAISLPVRGSWQIIIELDGPRGPGMASFLVTVAVPGAFQVWLGWLIGLLPLVGAAWLIWQQRRYRRTLVTEKGYRAH